MSLILLDQEGNVVKAMHDFICPDAIVDEDRVFDFEDRDGDDYIFRERPIGGPQ